MAWNKNGVQSGMLQADYLGGVGPQSLDMNYASPNWGMGKWPSVPQPFGLSAQQAAEQSARIRALEQWQMRAMVEISDLKEQVRTLVKLVEPAKTNGSLIPKCAPRDELSAFSPSFLPSMADPVKPFPPLGGEDWLSNVVPPEMALTRASTEPSKDNAPAVMALSRSKSGDNPSIPGGFHGQLQEQLIKESPDSPSFSRILWRIDNVRAKLKGCAGKALVSPPFEAFGMADMRLMVFPTSDQNRSLKTREQRNQYENMITNGPLNCALRLKVVSAPVNNSVLTFTLFVGNVSRGPLVHDFGEHIIHGCDDFKINWLDQVDESVGSLSVGVELRELRSKEEVQAAPGTPPRSAPPPPPPGFSPGDDPELKADNGYNGCRQVGAPPGLVPP